MRIGCSGPPLPRKSKLNSLSAKRLALIWYCLPNRTGAVASPVDTLRMLYSTGGPHKIARWQSADLRAIMGAALSAPCLCVSVTQWERLAAVVAGDRTTRREIAGVVHLQKMHMLDHTPAVVILTRLNRGAHADNTWHKTYCALTPNNLICSRTEYCHWPRSVCQALCRTMHDESGMIGWNCWKQPA